MPSSTKIGLGTKVKRFFVGQGKDVGAMTNPTRTGGLLGKAKGLVNRGKNLVDDGVKAVGKKGILGKLGKLTKGLPKMGIGKLLGKVFGPLITFFSELTSEDGGLASALAATAGFMAGAKVGAAAGAAIGAFFGGVGAGPGAFIGGLIGGLAGETLMKSIVKKIMGALGLKDIKVFGNKDKKETEGQKTIEVDGKLLSEKDYSKEDIELLNSGSAKLDASGNIVPIKSNNGNAAEQISSFEDKPEVVTVDMGGATNGQSGGVNASGVSMKEGDSLPNIGFDDNNPHTIYATATTGAG
mgnify:FL=1